MADVKIEISVNSGGRPFVLVLELEEALELKDKLNVMFPSGIRESDLPPIVVMEPAVVGNRKTSRSEFRGDSATIKNYRRGE